jgi:hypothetical protein
MGTCGVPTDGKIFGFDSNWMKNGAIYAKKSCICLALFEAKL